MTIKINNEDLVIRPSAVDGFFACAYQWGKMHLEMVQTIPNSRAAIGTAIHAAAECLWTDAIKTGKKDDNISKLTDAAVEAWKEETHKGVSFDEGENHNTAIVEIVKGTEAFVEDIVPFAAIPKAVEERYTIELDHPLVKRISGTVDYITEDTIADIKTSKRKIGTSGYVTQQSIYKMLAKANGVDVQHNLIQGVTLKKTGAEGTILVMDVNEEQSRQRVNMMLDTLELIHQDRVPIEQLLRPNPQHYLCSPKYCALYDKCPAIKE